MNKCAIVAGANGFIGKAIVSELINNGYIVKAIINKNKDNLLSSANLTYCNYSDLDDRQDELFSGADYLFNLIWGGMTGESMADYNLQMNNINITMNMLNYCEKYGIKYVHAASLIEHEAYNNTFKTENLPGRSHVYGAAKFAAHVFSRFYAKEHNIPYTCGLITNTYGPKENNNRLITGTLKKIHDGTTPEFSRGDQLYDFIYITDAAKAFRLIAEKGLNKTYVVGSGTPHKLRYYLEIVNQIVAPEMNFIYGTANVSVDYLGPEAFDTNTLYTDTGFEPQIPFDVGILQTYRLNYEDK